MTNSDLYRRRCNDPVEYAKWRASGLVRIDALRRGDVFESICGTFWQVDRTAQCSTVLCTAFALVPDQPAEDVFISGAMVRPVRRKRDVDVTFHGGE